MFINLPFIFGDIFKSLLTTNFTNFFRIIFNKSPKKDVAVH